MFLNGFKMALIGSKIQLGLRLHHRLINENTNSVKYYSKRLSIQTLHLIVHHID